MSTLGIGSPSWLSEATKRALAKGIEPEQIRAALVLYMQAEAIKNANAPILECRHLTDHSKRNFCARCFLLMCDDCAALHFELFECVTEDKR